MIDPSVLLQDALTRALKGAPSVASFVGQRIYDQPPKDASFPYVVLGDCQIVPDKADCIDGVEAYPIIDVWSQTQGYGEAKKIAGAIVALLDDRPENVSLSGFEVSVFEIDTYQPLRDPDGITRRVSLTFHALINPAS